MIPFVDLKAQYAAIKPEVDRAIGGVLENCDFVLGRDVAAFEKEFAEYCDSDHGIGVNTGTSALLTIPPISKSYNVTGTMTANS